MQNFDEAREAAKVADRTFQIGGEVFVRKVGVRPEVIAAYESLDEQTGATETLALIDQVVIDMLDDAGQTLAEGDEIKKVGADGHKRYRKLRERETDPLSLGDMTSLIEWLIETETGRVPTQQPSPSRRGRGATATN